MGTRTLLVDGDTFIFTAASANEFECQWETWLWTLHADFNAAVRQLDDTLNAIASDVQADRVIVALTDDANWRKSIMPSYKHNRVAKRKPVIYKALREYIAETREVFQKPTLEGDDVLGILATHPKFVPGEKIIVSLDKDMKTIPGDLLNYGQVLKARKDDPSLSYVECIQTITEADADRWHLIQTLSGDVTDGYPGCPGVGAVNAAKLLDEGRVLEPVEKTISRGPRKGEVETSWEPGREGTPWEIVVSAFKRAGLNEAVALQNAQVARICRKSEYDFQQGAVKPWLPPTK